MSQQKPENTYQTLTVSLEEQVAHIRLSRPDSMNSMVPAFWKELPAALREIDADAEARVVVISSTGKHFSAGMDLAVFTGMAGTFEGEQARRAERFRRLVLELQDAFNAIEELRMPVIAAVQGGAIGGAVDLLCACDMRYSTEDAYFSIKETQIGMTADLGTLQRLPRLIPVGLAKELAYTGRDFSADEALRAGFVNQVYADQEALLSGVMEIATVIAQQSPMAVSGCKHMINYALDHSLADSLNHMATWQSGMFQMPDVQTALAARQTGSTPQFDNLHGGGSQLHTMSKTHKEQD
ncbi:crotonase/enoyl-CoA hydratase family protein [Alteromonas sp. ASW11-19]|uniref:Crotonase/enoyl-CoA hydratase family protein n=1 Tax=Alteromonas salexigens TaxID=2982530 RepID=A0ABT2VSP9_9ALTE|nr:crotonase/enoyl-CoA hydratase family protein [Alteromonas salexigens]MCU7555953.1 crotonase/enoyl-CoA hydratase family protein [Alteromonas salexigens]